MKLLILLLTMFSINTFALDTKLTLELVENQKSWDVGEIKNFRIMLHPISEVNDEDIKNSLLARDFVDMIKILKIHKQSVLRENPEYYVIDARGVLLKEPRPNFPKIWDYRGMAVAVDYTKISFANTPASSKDFFIFDKSVSGELNKLIIGLIILVTLFVLVAIFMFYKKMSEKQTRLKQWRLKVEEFKNISDRDGHEHVYQNKERYEELFDDRKAFVEYLQLTNSVQYKKNLDDSDLIALEKAHAKAKEKIVVR